MREMEREKFSSRLGFLLISAGCAIGLGNVWRFPYITGKYGGAAFVLVYLFFLIILGLPIMAAEFSVGRASQKSIAKSFDVLEPKGSKWHIYRYFGIAGNYLLMMFYTMVGGWLIQYFLKMAKGEFAGMNTEQVSAVFAEMTSNTGAMTIFMIITVIIGFLVCSFGLNNGVEKINKLLMVTLLLLMIVLAVRSVTLPGAVEGLKFYLIPDFKKMKENGIGEAVFAAMGQAFFTLSIGIGALAIFGSYIDKERSLGGEAVSVMVLDTAVAIIAGLIIFPSCFAFGINPGEGAGLVFLTLPNVFNAMPGGRVWGSLFFICMAFAAMTTIIAVFQNIIAYAQESWGWSTRKAVWINCIAIIVLSMPCILGFTNWSHITILGKSIMDFEDFLVSNNLLPLGSLVYLLFCVGKHGWGFDNFIREVNYGKGLKMSAKIRPYLRYGLPLIVLIIFAQGYWNLFQSLAAK